VKGRVFRVLLVVVVVLTGLGAPRMASSAPTPTHVLYISSYDQRMTWVQDITRGVVDVLKPEDNNIVLHIFHMDSKQFSSESYFAAVRELLRVKYEHTQFSLVMCSDNNAFEFVRANRDALFPGAPVAFSGVNSFEDSQLQGFKGVTGVAETLSAHETVEAILKLHPDTREIFILNDYLESGRKWVHDLDAQLGDLKGRVRFRHNDNLSFEDLKKQLARLDSTTIVLLGVYYSDKNGVYFTFEKVGTMLAESSPVPVYCLTEFNIGNGVLGGKVISGYYQGQTMALLGKRLLAGEAAESIPVVKQGANRFMFDYAQLRRFGIRQSALPSGSLIVNRPFSIYEAYKIEIWSAAGAIGILFVSVIFLGVQLRLRRRAEQALRSSEEGFRQLSNATWEGIVIHDHGLILRVNEMFQQMVGYSSSELLGKDIVSAVVVPQSADTVRDVIAHSRVEPYEATLRRKDDTLFPVDIRVRNMVYEGKAARVAAVRDLTDYKLMEGRLAQSQKMEAIGTLAGGIAHDFNNILTAIFGYLELSRLDAPAGSELSDNLDQMMVAATRARELVRQILAFSSRRAKQEPRSLALRDTLQEAMKMLRASLPATVDIRVNTDVEGWVRADASQIHQVIVNLCTNASLAMRESGGMLDVSLRMAEVPADERSLISSNLAPGRYMVIVVSDTGTGMSPEVQRRIFEPFFTTRPQGQGTGLGLSVVHGIIQSLGGTITVQSEVGKGSSFSVFLPAVEPQPACIQPAAEALPTGSERILFVDDEPFQVDLASKNLGRLGYAVTVITSSEQALELFRQSPNDFDIVITDMTMPKMTGDVLIEKIRTIRPEIPVILCTGYDNQRMTDDVMARLKVHAVLMKPPSIEQMSRTIRSALDTRH